jgi:hypothetical protein
MRSALAGLLIVTCCLFARSDDTEVTNETLLDRAHSSIASLPQNVRLDALADLVGVAAKVNSSHVAEWISEVDRIAAAEPDPCRAVRYRGLMTEIVSARNPEAALQRLRSSSGPCNSFTGSLVAGHVFRAMFAKYRLQSIDEIIQAADSLGSLGYYPYSGVASIYKQAATGDRVAATRMFLQAILSYKNAPALEWRVHSSFLKLVQEARDCAPREALQEAVQLAFSRMSEKKENSDTGAQQLTLTKDAGPQAHTERDDAISQLYAVALAVDPSFAKRVLEHWPQAAAQPASNEGFVAGVAMAPGSKGMPKSAQRFLEIQQARQRLANVSSLKDLQSVAMAPALEVAVLADRASSQCSKHSSAGKDFLAAADTALRKVEDPEERLSGAAYVGAAATDCKEPEIAGHAIEVAFTAGLPLIREQAQQADFVLTRSSTYSRLRRAVVAVGSDRHLALPYIDKLQNNDELQARLLVAIVESSAQSN